MAVGNFILDKGYDAGGAILKRRAVKFSAQDTVVQVTASTDIVIGVEQFGVSTAEIARGKGASVRELGITEWEAGAAVAVGQEVMADTSGRCIPATGAGNRVKGQCVSDAAVNAGDVCSVLLYSGGRTI